MKRSKLYHNKKWTIKEVIDKNCHLEDVSLFINERCYSVTKNNEYCGITKWYHKDSPALKKYFKEKEK